MLLYRDLLHVQYQHAPSASSYRSAAMASWGEMQEEILLELDEANATYFALTLHYESSRRHLVSSRPLCVVVG